MNIVNVVNYEGLYCVTDEGDIFSLKRVCQAETAS